MKVSYKLFEKEENMRNLYWSHIKMMKECPQRYLWSKGHPKYDLGNGLGKKKSLPPEEGRESEHHRLMGSVLSKVVELVYNDELWKEPKTLMEKAVDIAYKEFIFLESEHYCVWSYMTRQEAIDCVIEGAKNFIRIMKENRLIGPWSRSEVKMTPRLNNYVNISGIADLVYRDKDDRIHILDGKNAMTPNKYEDPDQLRWYALSFMLQYGKMPERLAFFYFRYPPKNPPKDYDGEWNGVIEVSITKEDMKRLSEEAVNISKEIHFGKAFPPKPKAKHCQFCPYESVCEERQEQKELNRAKRKPKEVVNPFTEDHQGKTFGL